jgi:hypothetical protein
VIKTLFRYVAYALITLITLFLILFAYGRLRGPTPEQQAALALLDKRPSFKPEQNLAPYLSLMEYDVPADKVTAFVYPTDGHIGMSMLGTNIYTSAN